MRMVMGWQTDRDGRRGRIARARPPRFSRGPRGDQAWGKTCMLELGTSTPSTATSRRCATSASRSAPGDRHPDRRERREQDDHADVRLRDRPPTQGDPLQGSGPPRGPERDLRLGFPGSEGGASSHLTVVENLDMGPFSAARTGSEHDTSACSRSGRAAAPGGRHLSGGEQKMLAISRALMARPDCALDAPSSGSRPDGHLIFEIIERSTARTRPRSFSSNRTPIALQVAHQTT